jgi:galactonate dehydratase
MIIKEVEIFDVNLGWVDGSSFWNLGLIRIKTDEGISGLGEVGLAYGTGNTAAIGMLKNLAEQFLIGIDPFRVEYIWNKMFRDTFWGQGGGPVIYGGMSAIDEALLDIKGKALNVPVYDLIGGKCFDTLRVYANGWYNKCIHPEQYAEAALKVVGEGYDALKFDPFGIDIDGVWRYPSRNLTSDRAKLAYERIKAVRKAIGEDVDILIEVHGNLGVSSAIQMGKQFEEFHPFFYEEPIDAMNVECMKKVSENVNIPIAAGERLYTRYGFRQYIEKQALDILQPDIGLAGGLTEVKKIADYADTYNIHIQPHNCIGPIATAVAIQLDAAIPNFIIQEWSPYRPSNIYNLVDNPLEHKVKNSYITVPDLPGLGVELVEDAVKKYSTVIKIK